MINYPGTNGTPGVPTDHVSAPWVDPATGIGWLWAVRGSSGKWGKAPAATALAAVTVSSAPTGAIVTALSATDETIYLKSTSSSVASISLVLPDAAYAMKILVLILAFASLAAARSVPVSWDANPADQVVLGYRLYVGGTLTAATTSTTWSLTLPDTEASVTLTAFNEKGESPHTAPLVIPAVIPAPVATLQRSKDLVTWAALMPVTAQNQQRLRVKITPRTGELPAVEIEQTNDDGLTWVLITAVPYDPPEFFRIKY